MTYPWFNDPRIHERERKRTILFTLPELSRDIATGSHYQKTTPERTKPPLSYRTVSLHRTALQNTL